MDTILNILSDLAEGSVDKAFDRVVEVAKNKQQQLAAPHTEKNAAEESFKRSQAKKNKGGNKAAQKVPMDQRKPCDNMSGEKHTHETPSAYQTPISPMNYTKLQEAIVMSELLGKPVSKKRRNRVGR